MHSLDYGKSLRALRHFILDYNQDLPLAQQLRQGCCATAQEIIRVYGLNCRKAYYAKSTGEYPLPLLRTNSEALASTLGISARTVRRHIVRLVEAGILLSKQFRGRTKAYELHINPELLQWSVNTVVSKTCSAYKAETETTTCPQIETYSTYNNLLIAVDKSEAKPVLNKAMQRPSHPFKGYTTGNTPLGLAGNATTVVRTNQSTARQQISAASNRSKKMSGLRDSTVQYYVDSFWLAVKMSLYPDKSLSISQITKAKAHLHRYYATVPKDKLGKVHSEYVERIALVRKHLQRDKRRYVQLPSRYFDPDYAHGFSVTRHWLAAVRKRKKEVAAYITAHRELQKVKQDKSDQLYQFKQSETVVQRLGNPEVLADFYQQVAAMRMIC